MIFIANTLLTMRYTRQVVVWQETFEELKCTYLVVRNGVYGRHS